MKPGTTDVIQLSDIRSSCTQCAWQSLCLPAALDGDNLFRLDEVVRKRRPRGAATCYREGQRHPALFVCAQLAR